MATAKVEVIRKPGANAEVGLLTTEGPEGSGGDPLLLCNGRILSATECAKRNWRVRPGDYESIEAESNAIDLLVRFYGVVSPKLADD